MQHGNDRLGGREHMVEGSHVAPPSGGLHRPSASARRSRGPLRPPWALEAARAGADERRGRAPGGPSPFDILIVDPSRRTVRSIN